jgi:hypothetical protein
MQPNLSPTPDSIARAREAQLQERLAAGCDLRTGRPILKPLVLAKYSKAAGSRTARLHGKRPMPALRIVTGRQAFGTA